mgnify:CR=1 FL=1
MKIKVYQHEEDGMIEVIPITKDQIKDMDRSAESFISEPFNADIDQYFYSKRYGTLFAYYDDERLENIIGLIPKMDFNNEIPDEYRTMVVIPTILNSGAKVEELMTKLEVFKHALSNTLGIDLCKSLWNKRNGKSKSFYR